MITKDEIRTTLSDIRFYYAKIVKFIGVRNVKIVIYGTVED